MGKVKMLVMDVDGTLTDGRIYISVQGELAKAFNVKDGQGIANLGKCGITPVIITGRESKIVAIRAQELGVKDIYQNVHDKKRVLLDLACKKEISLDDIAYIGDDLNDYDCIKCCGITGCPNDAIDEIKNEVDYICRCAGGKGAVREFIDWLTNKNNRGGLS